MNILLTGLGGDIAQNVIRVLRKHYSGANITGTDMSSQPFYSNFADGFARSPSANDSKYLDFILDLIAHRKIDILVPTSDLEIRLLSNFLDEIAIPIIVCNQETIEIGSDKLLTNSFLLSIGSSAPLTSDNLKNYTGSVPIVVKPRFGSGSRDLRVCHSISEAAQFGELLAQPIYQECLLPSNSEVTCGIYRSILGETRVIQLLRVLSGGRTLWAQVIYDNRVDLLCKKIAFNLNLVGSMNIQLILTDNGPRIFEINPRISSTVAMRDSLGFQDLFWSIEEALGNPLPTWGGAQVGTMIGRLDELVVLTGDKSL